MTDRRFFMLMGTVIAIATIVSLYFVNSIYAGTLLENEEVATENFADIYRRSIEFNGMEVNRDLKLSEYSRRGKLMREDMSLGELLGEKGCIALLSTNNCPGCVKNEIAMLRRLDKHGRILFIYDSPIHVNNGGHNIPAPVYYEFDRVFSLMFRKTSFKNT